MISDYNNWLNESNEQLLPIKGREIWNKVLEILPELKKGSWKKDTTSDAWLWNIPHKSVAGKWKGQHGDLSEWEFSYGLATEDEIEGFSMYDYGEVCNDPVEIARIINQHKAESWMTKNKYKGWAMYQGKKFGL